MAMVMVRAAAAGAGLVQVRACLCVSREAGKIATCKQVELFPAGFVPGGMYIRTDSNVATQRANIEFRFLEFEMSK